VAAERQQLWDRTQAEIDELVNEYHKKLTKENAQSIGAIYARYSTQFQDSIADQVRSLLEAAIKKGVFVPREHIYVDLAVRGYRDNRPGLNALRDALAAKRVQVMLVFTTNRLFRKHYKALKFIEEEIVERGLRCLFVKNNLDTSDGDRWRLPFQIHAAIDEAGTSMYAENIRAAHQGLFRRHLVTGTIPLGYRGEPIPGEFTKRQRPRCRVVIDPATAKYVTQIFDWYVKDLLSILEIARRLNEDPDAPGPPTSTTGMWTYPTIVRLLRNARYRGFWEYGKMKVHYVSQKDYLRQIPRDEALEAELIEELRIVPDDVWYAAQSRRLKDPGKRGRKPKDGNRRSRPKLLNGLFVCPEHNQPLYVGGSHGTSMACKVCRVTPAKNRPLISGLNRKLALQLTCNQLAELVRGDIDLIDQIIMACQQEAASAQRPDPEGLRQLKVRAEKLSKAIMFNRRNPGLTTEEQDAAAALIRQLGVEHAEVMSKIKLAEAVQNRQIVVPTEQTIKSLLVELANILTTASLSTCEEEQGSAREVIRLLTGGRIDLYQQGERAAQRGWLQGRFTIRLLDFLVERVSGVPPTCEHPAIDVTIDYRKPRPSADQAERAFELYSAGHLCAEIATILGCSRSRVTKLLEHAHEKRGLKKTDGRSRRSTLKKKHTEPPLYRRLSDPAKALWDQELLMQEIADRLDCEKNTITSAIRFWFESRHLPVPDGRRRRKNLGGNASKTVPNPASDADGVQAA